MLSLSRGASRRCQARSPGIRQMRAQLRISLDPQLIKYRYSSQARTPGTSFSSSSTAARIQRRLADRFIQGYNDLTTTGLLAPRAKDCEHHVLPANLRRPVRGNSEYAEFFAPLIPHLKNFKMVAHRYVNDPAEKTIAVYATGSATTPWGPYENSYVFFLTCDWEREEVVRVEEFLDSKFSGEFFERMKAWEKERKEGGEAEG